MQQKLQFATTVINVLELRYGSARREDHDQFWSRLVHTILSRVKVLPLTARAAVIAGDMRATLERNGQPIGLADVLIGAIAMSHDCPIATGNVRHFERIDGLEVEDWTAATS